MGSRDPVLIVWLDVGVSLSLLVDDNSSFDGSLRLLLLGSKEGVVRGVGSTEQGRAEQKPEEEEGGVEPR